MKQHSQIRSLLIGWIDRSLSEQQRRSIEDHLTECSPCRQYFETMSQALLPSSNPPQPSLIADAYLPTRIKSLADHSTSEAVTRRVAISRWTFRTAAFSVAVVFGVYLGEKLSYETTTVTDQNIIAEYSTSLETSGIEGRLQTVTQATGEESK